MKKEVSKPVEKKENISDIMAKYEASFSISLSEGFAHIKFREQKMYVTWLNEDGYVEDDGQEVPLEDIERVASFMAALKELKLTDFQRKL